MADLSSLLGAAGIGGAIGKAIVSLELETTKYQAELKAANAQTVASTNSSSSAFSKFGSLASTALLGVGAAAVAGAALSIKAAIDANEAHLKLQNTFANNATLADSSVAAFEKQADALRDLTGVDDEAIITGQALIGSMNRTGAEVLKLTPLVVDLATKYDIDLQSAFKAVGKAADGNTGALARYVGQIEPASTKAGQFQNVLDALGKSEGFAAERADAEPWRLIGQRFEEIAETIGQQLLPVIEDLSQVLVDNIDIVEKVAGSFEHLLNIYKDVAAISFAPWTVAGDTFRELGGRVDELNLKFPELSRALEANKLKADLATAGFHDFTSGIIKTGDAADQTGKDIVKFAHMTGKDLKEWSDKTKESFESYVINLDKVNEATDFTRKDLRDSFRAMLEHARDLNQAMRTLSREHWINDDFVAFLAEQPAKLILFADSNETQQRRMQTQWEKSGDILHNQINQRLDVMTGALDKLDKSETKHKIIFEYSYEGFDPSKPGMSDRTGRGGQQ